jgi:2'-hydroxyisoflavone reductase
MLPDVHFDAVVDFCGYKAGEIEGIIEHLGGRIGQYVFFSTISICDPSIQDPKTESSPLANLSPASSHPVMNYLYQKKVLEAELRTCCTRRHIPWTIFRPSFIYGPFNYAPRESYFIKMISEGLPVPYPEDAFAEFSMVYVEDIAQAIHAVIGEPAAHDRVFNLAAPERITYARLFDELRACHGSPFSIRPVSIAEVYRDGIPLPFPLDANDLSDGSLLSNMFDFQYTPFSGGFARTYKAFSKVYM